MAARSGMADLIKRLRSMTAAGSADYSVNSVTYWTDDQLQSILDQHRHDFRALQLNIAPVIESGAYVYRDYYIPRVQWIEGTASGTASFLLANAAGGTVAYSAYSANLDAQHLQFTADQLGTAYYLSGREFDLYRAAADVWEQKAADVADRFDLRTDNHDMKRSQLYDHYSTMAKRMRARSAPKVGIMTRPDTWTY